MSQQYDNTNRGAIFQNDRKEKDSHPDYKGQINVEGVEFWVSAWIKETRNGDEFFSLSVTPKQAQQEQRRTRQATPRQAPKTHGQMQQEARGQAPKSNTGFDDMDDDIPF